MSMPRQLPLITVDQYLKMERAAEERHEYIDGIIYAMAGESLSHGRVTVNLLRLLANQLLESPCEALTKDTKVRSGPTPMSGQGTAGMFSYPDLLVVCGEIEFHDAVKDVILNPKLILEALSPSTEAFNRGEKFERYKKWNPTMSDYVLVSQDEPRIEHYQRQTDDSWTCKTASGLDAVVVLESIQCSLKLADVYHRVVFA